MSITSTILNALLDRALKQVDGSFHVSRENNKTRVKIEFLIGADS